MTQLLKTTNDITAWLERMEVKNYTLKPHCQYNWVVDARGDVDLSYQNLNVIPVKFDQVLGDFYCHGNHLTSLLGCPSVVGENFFCHNNALDTLVYFPQNVGGITILKDNPLLGSTQYIEDFDQLYVIHTSEFSLAEKQNLHSHLSATPVALTKIHKI